MYQLFIDFTQDFIIWLFMLLYSSLSCINKNNKIALELQMSNRRFVIAAALYIFLCFLLQSITSFDSFSQFIYMFTIVSELLEPYLTYINKHKNTAWLFAGVLKWEGLVCDYVQICLMLAMKYKEINSVSSTI